MLWRECSIFLMTTSIIVRYIPYMGKYNRKQNRRMSDEAVLF